MARRRHDRRDTRERGSLPLAAACAVGALAGLGGFVVVYGDGTAYLSSDPAACTNCHVMQGHFDSWQQSTHRHVTVCNDCHLPPGVLDKWLTKTDNGVMHSYAFTTGDFPDPIRIKPRNARRTQRSCLKCHGELVHALGPIDRSGEMPACVRCHASVGHAQRR
ncbi:MAG TPA: cytochrome c nitrite reductase small subunit [Candidatus Polarisedimenticolaceae bacterium]|nr:cytochrome c nitrite reductase small subunit [Candidatus Polarisedimenticolaceae bacterium]